VRLELLLAVPTVFAYCPIKYAFYSILLCLGSVPIIDILSVSGVALSYWNLIAFFILCLCVCNILHFITTNMSTQLVQPTTTPDALEITNVI
jgi:hypothetical protein